VCYSIRAAQISASGARTTMASNRDNSAPPLHNKQETSDSGGMRDQTGGTSVLGTGGVAAGGASHVSGVIPQSPRVEEPSFPLCPCATSSRVAFKLVPSQTTTCTAGA
jgi:hypothetical protein